MTREEEKELVFAIKRKQAFPFKFAYLGDGAKAWKKIARIRKKQIAGITDFEQNILKNQQKAIVGDLKGKFMVFDIRCGDGKSAFLILKNLEKKNFFFLCTT